MEHPAGVTDFASPADRHGYGTQADDAADAGDYAAAGAAADAAAAAANFATAENPYGAYSQYIAKSLPSQASYYMEAQNWQVTGDRSAAAAAFTEQAFPGREVCRDFLQGRCARGTGCRYLHQAPERGFVEPEPCRDFLVGRCMRPYCRYLHAGAPLCRDFFNGFCSRGTECRLSHVEHIRRPNY
eukprot:SM000092S24496  [mRNA]  locus=s92:366600:368226:+ [translate_table: standard]